MFSTIFTFSLLLMSYQIHLSYQEKFYSLSFVSNTINILVNEKQNIDLHLKPILRKNDSDLHIKFACQNSDNDEKFDWNSSKNNCSILELLNGYDYEFTEQNSSSLSLLVKGLHPGKTHLVGNTNDSNTDYKKAYLTINVGLSNTILWVSFVVGWIYFSVWSISFYPQIWDNFRSKSCAGLNIDYAILNIIGFFSYTVFNISMYYIKDVQLQYEAKNPRSQIPVEFNDVVFGVHALLCSSLLVWHYFIYDSGQQRLSWFARGFLLITSVGYIILGILTWFTDLITILQLVYIASYVKLAVTLIKYIPQGYYNYQRKSTVGWSIVNIFLDTTGGTLSMIQMFMLAYNYDDWATIFNNFTKFGLGLISILFDLFFLIQHYILYPQSRSISTSSLVEEVYNPQHKDAKSRTIHDDDTY